MVESLRLDSDGADAVSRELLAIADDLAAQLDRAEAGLAATGAPWGNDATGRAFARSYVPDSQQVTTAGKDAVAWLRDMSAGVASLVRSLQTADEQGAQQIAASGVAPVDRPVGNVVVPQASTTAPDASIDPTSDDGSQQQDVAPQAEATTSDTESPTTDAPQQGSPTTAPTDTPQSGVPDAPQQPSSPAPTGPNSTGTQPTSEGNPSAGSPTPEQTATPSRASMPNRPVTGRGGPTPSEEREAQALSREASDAETVRLEPTRPSRVTAPALNGVSPATPAGGTRPTDEEEDTDDKDQKRPTRSSDRVSPRDAAKRTCAGHGVEVTGFDDLDASEDVLAEIAAAVDAVCGRYPWIGVRRVGTAELDSGEWARTRWNCLPGEDGHPVPYTDHILFSSAAARVPDEFAEIVDDATSTGYYVVGSARRPVYSTIIRELGHAMDVAGAFGARAQAQRTLIAAYLGGDDRPKTVSLARVVGGFHDWRASLPRCCFRGNRFHPSAALAEAFTEVVLYGDAAGAPAKALHRLVVETAREAREQQQPVEVSASMNSGTG